MYKTAIFIGISLISFAFGSLDRIRKAIEKGEFEKAEELISKGLRKEPQNPGIHFFKAALFFNKSYSKYQPDSARMAINKAVSLIEEADQELLDDLLKDDIDEEVLLTLQNAIRDTAFQNTTKNLSIREIDAFTVRFPSSIYEETLKFKKDSIRFHNAKQVGTENVLMAFLASNPHTAFRATADSLLDKLRYTHLKGKGSLADYYTFLNQYPDTRFREDIEYFVLKLGTASHEVRAYEAFRVFSKTNKWKLVASDILYYLNGKKAMGKHPKRDSIRMVDALKSTSLFPVIEADKIGFYSHEGSRMTKSRFEGITESNKCESIDDDWIYVMGGKTGNIITKTGAIVLSDVEGYRSISVDLGLVKSGENWKLYHKSGYQVLDAAVTDAALMDNRWIKVQQNGKWGLVSYLGVKIAEIIYDDISKNGTFWVFEKDELLAVYTTDLIMKEVEDRGLTLEFKFDDIERIGENKLIGFRENKECLLDSTLNFLIPWGSYEINPDEAGWYLRTKQGYRLYNQTESELTEEYFPYLESNDGWLTLKTTTDWMLLPRKKGLFPSRGYDSVRLINNHAVVLIQEGKKELMFGSGTKQTLTGERINTFPKHPDFISTTTHKLTKLYNAAGETILEGNFSAIDFANDTLVKATVRGKQGLLSIQTGDWILNPVFESLDEKDGLILTLIKGKIGCYDPAVNKLMTTEYESRVEHLGTYYKAKKNGKYGIIDFTKEEIIAFDYDEIQQWNDTSYLVKKGAFFYIINHEEADVFEPIERLQRVVKNETHAIYRFIKNGKYGLISTVYGELLKAEFTDVFNISSTESPLFFADQHLDKAGYHVVSYVNETGKLVLSRAYTKAEFEKILCDN